jgi:hypothetical protein
VGASFKPMVAPCDDVSLITEKSVHTPGKGGKPNRKGGLRGAARRATLALVTGRCSLLSRPAAPPAGSSRGICIGEPSCAANKEASSRRGSVQIVMSKLDDFEMLTAQPAPTPKRTCSRILVERASRAFGKRRSGSVARAPTPPPPPPSTCQSSSSLGERSNAAAQANAAAALAASLANSSAHSASFQSSASTGSDEILLDVSGALRPPTVPEEERAHGQGGEDVPAALDAV